MTNRFNEVLFTPTEKAAPAVADLSSFYQVYDEEILETEASSGDNTLSFSGTPSGVIHVITIIVAVNLTSPIDKISVRARINENVRRIISKVNLLENESVDFSGQVVLDENNYIEAVFSGCSAGDVLVSTALGHDVKKY